MIMKKKFTALCSVMIVFSICVAIFGATGFNGGNDVTTATIKEFYAPKEETTAGVLDGIGDVLGGIGDGSSGDIGDVLGGIGSGSSGGLGDSLGGIGDAMGGIGDALGGVVGGMGDSLGGIFGGLGNGSGTVVKTTAPATTSADIGLIVPVPAATQAPSETQTPSTSSDSSVAGETVDFASTTNP